MRLSHTYKKSQVIHYLSDIANRGMCNMGDLHLAQEIEGYELKSVTQTW